MIKEQLVEAGAVLTSISLSSVDTSSPNLLQVQVRTGFTIFGEPPNREPDFKLQVRFSLYPEPRFRTGLRQQNMRAVPGTESWKNLNDSYSFLSLRNGVHTGARSERRPSEIVEQDSVIEFDLIEGHKV